MGSLHRRLVAVLLFLGAPPGCFQDEGPDGAESASGGGSGGGEAGLCSAYVEKAIACDTGSGSATDLLAECEAGLDMFVGACRDAYVDVLTCYSASSCAALESGMACQAEVSAFTACVTMTSPACTAYGQTAEGCGFEDSAAQGAAACQAEISASGGGWCGLATEELYACLAELSCGDLWTESGCVDARQMVMTVCV